MTFENALTKAAGVIGWPEVAKICGMAEVTVRNWSDPDTTAKLPLEAAFLLDAAFVAAGGEEPPFLSCYATRLGSEIGEIHADRTKLLASVAIAARENGEAVAATIAAAAPDSTPADLVIAERELENAISSGRKLMVALRAMLRKFVGERTKQFEHTPGIAARELGCDVHHARTSS